MTEGKNGSGPIMPLGMVKTGETVKLIEIQGGRKIRKRLADLGLNIGMSARIVQGGFYGPIILAVKDDSRLALGRGVAHKILVSLPADSDEDEESEADEE